MKRLAHIVIRYPWLVLGGFFVVIAAGMLGGFRPKPEDDILKFLPPKNRDVQIFREISKTFGGLEVAMIGIETPDVFDPGFLKRLDTLTGDLRDTNGVDRVVSLTNLADFEPDPTKRGIKAGELVDVRQFSRPDYLKRLRSRVLGKEHVAGQFVDREGKATLVLCFLVAGVNQQPVVGKLRAVTTGIMKGEKLYWGGAPFASTYIFETTNRDLKRLTPFALAAIILVMLIAFRDAIGVVLSLLSTAVGAMVTFSLMVAFGVKLNLVLSSMPVILFAVGSAYGIHILSRYYRSRKTLPNLEAIEDAVVATGPAVIATGLTTMAGFLSFLVMDIPPMQQFGLFTAVGIGAAVMTALCVIPALLSIAHRLRGYLRKNDGMPGLLSRYGNGFFFALLFAGVGTFLLETYLPPPPRAVVFVVLLVTFFGLGIGVQRLGWPLSGTKGWDGLNRAMGALAAAAARQRVLTGMLALALAAVGVFFAVGVKVQVEPSAFYAKGSDPDRADAFMGRHFGGSQFIQVHFALAPGSYLPPVEDPSQKGSRLGKALGKGAPVDDDWGDDDDDDDDDDDGGMKPAATGPGAMKPAAMTAAAPATPKAAAGAKPAIEDPLVMREVRRFAERLAALPGVSSVLHMGLPLSLGGEMASGLRRIPDTRGRVKNVYGLVSTDPTVNQLLSPPHTDLLVHIKIRSSKIEVVNRVLRQVTSLVKGDLRRNLYWVNLADAKDPALRKRAVSTLVVDAAQHVLAEAKSSELKVLSTALVRLEKRYDSLYGKPAAKTPGALKGVTENLGSYLLSSEFPGQWPQKDVGGKALDRKGIAAKIARAVAAVGPGAGEDARDSAVKTACASVLSSSQAMDFSVFMEREVADSWRTARANQLADAALEIMGSPPVSAAVRKRLADAAIDLDAPSVGLPWRDGDPLNRRVQLRPTVSGMPIVLRGLSRSVERNQILSLVASLGVVFLIMIVMFRSLWGGLVAMLPAGLTLLAVFGGLGLLGRPIDIGTSMVSGIAIGVGIDYAIHFITWWQPREDGDWSESARTAARESGSGIVANAMMVTGGFAVLTLGEAQPLKVFGLMIASAMMLAAMVTFVVIPAAMGRRSYYSREAELPDAPAESAAEAAAE